MSSIDDPLEYRVAVSPVLEYLSSLPRTKAINIHGNVYMERGTPDILGCINGRMIAFECKRSPEEPLEEIQKWRLSQWLEAGAVVGGISSVADVDIILRLMGVIE